MRTLFVTDPPPVVEDWLERRHALGQDLYDEVWEGEYHVAAAPRAGHADVQFQLVRILAAAADAASLHGHGPSNIGSPSDFRVPDLVFFRGREDRVWNSTAAIVVEVVSPGDESRAKLGFYVRAEIDEVLIVDPDARSVEWFVRRQDALVPADGSALLGILSTDLAARIDWPH